MPLPRISMECRVVADPELRYAPSGVAVVRLRTVSADRTKNDKDEWVDGDTLWMDVTVFKKLAENVAESVAKGDLLMVTGKIRTEEWEKEGEKRSKVSMIADTVSASMQFRTIPHAERQSSGGQSSNGGQSQTRRPESASVTQIRQSNDGWDSQPATDEPPFN